MVTPTTGALIAGNPPTQDSHHMPRNQSADNLIDKEQDGAGVCLCVFVFVRLSVCPSLHGVFAWCPSMGQAGGKEDHSTIQKTWFKKLLTFKPVLL